MTQKTNIQDVGDPITVGAWGRSEEAIEAFEQVWREGELPKIDDFLYGRGADRFALLVELIHVDLEFHLKSGETARVESYLDCYPRLTKDSAIVLELLEAEHSLRQRYDVAVSLDEYAWRFPTYIEELRRRVAGATTLPAR